MITRGQRPSPAPAGEGAPKGRMRVGPHPALRATLSRFAGRGSLDRRSALNSRPHRRTTMTAALETPTASKYPDVRNYIAGQFVDGDGARTLDVTNPAD